MMAAAIEAPTNAAGVSRGQACGNKIRMMMPSSPAPEETPIIWGSANGLRMTPCRMAPDKARFTPTKAATSVRGRRMLQITSFIGPSNPWNKYLQISSSEIETAPVPMLNAIPAAAATAIAANTKTPLGADTRLMSVFIAIHIRVYKLCQILDRLV